MTGATNDLVLEHVHHIGVFVDALHAELRDFLDRGCSAEWSSAGVSASDAVRKAEIERIKARLDRIERRLGLAGG
jgi:hypothetical protein